MTAAAPDALLRDRVHLRFSGPDALRYLNGQFTQQLDGLSEGESRYAFVCDAKGRILFDAYVYRMGEDLLVNAPLAIKDEVIARLDRYLIADDCEWSDESEQWAIAHHFLAEGESNPAAVNRFGSPGLDHYLSTEEADALTPVEDSESLENRRIAMGIPSLPDLVSAFSAETGRESAAVSFHKGCYLGQEVISRMKRAAKTNRTLISLSLSDTTSELPLDFVAEAGGKPLLQVTSISTHPDPEGHFPALGYLARRADPEAELICEQHPTLVVEDLTIPVA